MLYTKVNFIDATGYTYCWDRYYRQKILRGFKPQPQKFPECINFALGNLYVRLRSADGKKLNSHFRENHC
ncbi:hypothetical protein FEK96_28735 [Escherichia coli]|nr:hypothetical protein [Escherichia coli]EGO8044456.1 hypothetical protein [Escherichia coli]